VGNDVPRHALDQRIDQPREYDRNRAAQRDGLILEIHAPILFLKTPVGIEPPHVSMIVSDGKFVFVRLVEICDLSDARRHIETLCDRFEVSREGAHVDRKAFEVPLDPEEEEVVLNIEVFVGVNDVPVRSVDEFRNRGGDALLVRATYQQNGGVLHVCAGESLCISTAPGISVFELADRRTYTPEALPGELNFPSSHTLPARETGVVIALKPA